jgi:SAM-dependent methyltransferase
MIEDTKMDNSSLQQVLQDSQYTFPYHFIPQSNDYGWGVSRHLWWGYEYLAVLETVTSLAVQHAPTNVLDFGCGDGRLISELCKTITGDIAGVDVSERALSMAQAIIGNSDRVRFFKTLDDAKDGQFDVVIAMEVLEHIPPDQLQCVCDGISRVLKRKGCLILSVPTKNIPLNRKHYRHFALDDLKEETGHYFVVEEVYFIHRVGLFYSVLRRAILNQFVIPTWTPWVRLTTSLYRRYVMKANEWSGAHLVAVLRNARD